MEWDGKGCTNGKYKDESKCSDGKVVEAVAYDSAIYARRCLPM